MERPCAAWLSATRASVTTNRPRDLLRRHQELFPGSRQVHLALAHVLSKLGDSDGSATELEAAARPRQQGERLTALEDLARARAKVVRWKGGKFS